MQKKLRQIIQIGKQSRKAFKVVDLIIISTSKRKCYSFVIPNSFNTLLSFFAQYLHNLLLFFSGTEKSPKLYLINPFYMLCKGRVIRPTSSNPLPQPKMTALPHHTNIGLPKLFRQEVTNNNAGVYGM